VLTVARDTGLYPFMRYIEPAVGAAGEDTIPAFLYGRRQGERQHHSCVESRPRKAAVGVSVDEVAGALVYHRTLVYGLPVDDEFIENPVDHVLLPLLTGQLPSTLTCALAPENS
jgi:hypothetical protein